jgi:hypothetical protein
MRKTIFPVEMVLRFLDDYEYLETLSFEFYDVSNEDYLSFIDLIINN